MLEKYLTGRVKTALGSGFVLGIVCLIGVGSRVGWEFLFLMAMWYNRVLMGLVIGIADGWLKDHFILRGLLLGTSISFAFYFSTGFRDLPGFLAGMVYGILIDFLATRYPVFK